MESSVVGKDATIAEEKTPENESNRGWPYLCLSGVTRLRPVSQTDLGCRSEATTSQAALSGKME